MSYGIPARTRPGVPCLRSSPRGFSPIPRHPKDLPGTTEELVTSGWEAARASLEPEAAASVVLSIGESDSPVGSRGEIE